MLSKGKGKLSFNGTCQISQSALDVLYAHLNTEYKACTAVEQQH